MAGKIVYISAPYTNATQSLKTRIQALKQALRGSNILVLEWLSEDIPGTALYKRDMQNVQTCTTMVVFADEPSIGVGIEISEAMRERKAILCLYKNGSKISRLLSAAAAAYPAMRIIAYEYINDAAVHVRSFVEQPAGMTA